MLYAQVIILYPQSIILFPHAIIIHLKLIEGVLHRVTTVDEEEKCQLLLPLEHVPIVLEAMHNAMGHPGRDRM
jgi:hypothetical protein